MSYDALVVGLGAHGSAAAAALARRGLRVLGLERFGRGEARGSSGGWSRMIRITHYEDPWLVPLAEASWDRWLALGDEVGSTLLQETGGLYGGPPGHAVLEGSREGAARHDVPFEVLDAAEIHRRWPIFGPADDTTAVYEAKAGMLHADRANAAHLEVAERRRRGSAVQLSGRRLASGRRRRIRGRGRGRLGLRGRSPRPGGRSVDRRSRAGPPPAAPCRAGVPLLVQDDGRSGDESAPTSCRSG